MRHLDLDAVDRPFDDAQLLVDLLGDAEVELLLFLVLVRALAMRLWALPELLTTLVLSALALLHHLLQEAWIEHRRIHLGHAHLVGHAWSATEDSLHLGRDLAGHHGSHSRMGQTSLRDA